MLETPTIHTLGFLIHQLRVFTSWLGVCGQELQKATELVVNSDVYSSMYSYSHNNDDQHNTGIVVVHANKGDDIYVRIKMDKHVGDIWSDAYGRSTFAGWKIY